jgi:hypothetical protein
MEVVCRNEGRLNRLLLSKKNAISPKQPTNSSSATSFWQLVFSSLPTSLAQVR